MSVPVLDDRLRELAAAVADAAPPAAVDAAVAQAIARAKRPPAPAAPARAFDRWLVWPAALAASMLAIAALVRQVPPVDPAPVAAGPLAAPRAPFLPLVASEDIARATDAYVVPAQVPRLALAELGLPVDPARADQPVAAELLVRPDGAVLALRFLR